MGIEVEPLELPVESDVAVELVALQRRIDAVRDPDDPPVPAEALIPHFEVERSERQRRSWLAHDARELVGYLTADVRVEGANAGFAEIEVETLPDRVGVGIEHALVGAALGWLREQGARTLTWWPADERGREVVASLGLTFRQQERCSRMQVAEVDQDQQSEWIAAPRAREAGYRVVSWTGPCPDEHLDAYAVACSAMADAPLDDVEWVPHEATPDVVRGHERDLERLGDRPYVALALGPTGDAAGMSALCVHPARSWYGAQEDTAVVREHRGYALGRWLKAANLAQVRAAHPELEVVQTYNAETNPWMLAINVDMGFRPYRAYFAHQADLDDVTVG